MKKLSLVSLSMLCTLCVNAQIQTLQSVTDNGNATTKNIWVGMAPFAGLPEHALNLGGKLKIFGNPTTFTLDVDGTQPTIYRSGVNGLTYPFDTYDNLILQAGTVNKDLVFVTGSTPTPRMVVKGNGNVGIGTSSPGSYKLAVEGTIGARKVKVTQQTTWADFVFQDDYQLQALPDLEKYIQQNKHLPDIPSAKEVQQNGIDLGEMNAKLLQKIEELTLHIIELNKKNTALEQRMAAMERKEK